MLPLDHFCCFFLGLGDLMMQYIISNTIHFYDNNDTLFCEIMYIVISFLFFT